MEETVKLSVRAIAANENLSIEKLAEKCDLDPVHLRNVSLGRAAMSAKEIMTIAAMVGIDPHNIKY